MHKVKRYKYYFQQLEKPIVIEAISRKRADEILINLNIKMANWMNIEDLFDLLPTLLHDDDVLLVQGAGSVGTIAPRLKKEFG